MKLLLMFGMLWGGLYLASRKAPQPIVNDLAPTFFETEDTAPAKQQYNLVKPSKSASSADGNANIVKQLTVGDMVPDITFGNLINYPGTSTKLSDFKGKLVILDFWATWCGACIHKFSVLDSAQKSYADKLKVIAINCTKRTKDSLGKITAVINQWQMHNKRNFDPIVVTDTSSLFKKLFPHKSIPHYVWISSKGKVVAITGSEDVNRQNIDAFVVGRNLSLPVKNDYPDHPTKTTR